MACFFFFGRRKKWPRTKIAVIVHLFTMYLCVMLTVLYHAQLLVSIANLCLTIQELKLLCRKAKKKSTTQ